VRADLLVTIDKFSQDELTFTPFTNSWSVEQVMLHIAGCENYWLHMVVRHEIEQWKYYDFADHPTKAAIKKVLEGPRKKTVAFLEGLEEDDLNQVYITSRGESFPLQWIVWHVLEYEIHHRGELSFVLGLLRRKGLDV
jgi:uncharacterized damage-inducible protein DinB